MGEASSPKKERRKGERERERREKRREEKREKEGGEVTERCRLREQQ